VVVLVGGVVLVVLLTRVEHDAGERRITELYTKAADQLGSDRAPVRLAGLYALARLGETAESQRQTIVNVVCAYSSVAEQGDIGEVGVVQERLGQIRVVQIDGDRPIETVAAQWIPGTARRPRRSIDDIRGSLTTRVIPVTSFPGCLASDAG
jgi:hypothetical protein